MSDGRLDADARSPRRGVAPISAILDDVRSGRAVIMIDSSDPSNGGDLIVPAPFATADIVNLMAREARGLVCLAITAEHAGRLGLKLVPARARDGAAPRNSFAVSIEAREGVTTGISAHDRAHTIAVAVDPGSGPEDLVSPGHVFPIIARDGGVLMRAGGVEAAVDLARLAGHGASAAVCRILDEEGEVARGGQLLDLAERHAIRIGTIVDLIEHRRRSEKLVERTATAPFESRYLGDATIHVYRDVVDAGEHIALVRGEIDQAVSTLVRVHQVDLTTDLLGWSAGRRDYVGAALEAIAARDGPSVAVFVQDPCPTSIADRINGGRQDYMRSHALRDYGVGAQILLDLGVRKMILLTSSPVKLAALEGFGLEIVGRRPVVAPDA